MKRVDVHSEDFQRDFASHLLKEHRRETQFQIRNITVLTLYLLEERGCEVILDSKKGLYTISSPVPFGCLVTETEWRQDRFAVLKGMAFTLLANYAYAVVVPAIVFLICLLLFVFKVQIGTVVKLLGL
jgi:hypothetical protein